MKIQLLFLSLLFCLSCNSLDNQKACFLDFRLGMYEHEFEKQLSSYLETEVVEKRFYTENYVANKEAFVYTFQEINVDCIIEPLCMTNRLDELRLYTGTKESVLKNNKTAKRDFNKLLNYFILKYGKPSKHTKSKSQHEYVEWKNLKDFNFEIAYSPITLYNNYNNNSIDTINFGGVYIYFKPKKELEELLREYNCKMRNNSIPCDEKNSYLQN